MTTFEIYNIGDGLYLWRVIEASAALARDGTLMQVGKIGALLGLVTIAMRALLTGLRDFGVPQVLVGYVLFMLLFGTRAQVVVTDMYDQPNGDHAQVRTASDVPFGAALAASVISRVGFVLTERMEQAMQFLPESSTGAIGITKGGFGHSLQTLAQVRHLSSQMLLGNKALQSFSQSTELYVDGCLLPSVDAGLITVTPASLFNRPDPLEGIHHDPTGQQGSMWMSSTLLGNDGRPIDDAVATDCEDAYQRLKQYKDSFLLGDVDVAFKPIMGDGAVAKVQTELANLGSDATNSMKDYMAAMIIPAAYNRAAAAGSVSNPHETAATITLIQGLEQRSTQWAGEADMFHRIAQPMMSFFSGLIFALVPFMAFLVGLGQVGISLMMRYALLTLWVTLWPATMALVSLFYSTQLENFIHKMNSAALSPNGAVGVTSPQAVADLTRQAMDWLDAAAALAASTPALTLMLLFGGAVTATYLAGRLQGGDHINEKVMSPDAVQPGAVASVAPTYSHDPTHGTMQTGALADQEKMSISDVVSRAHSAAHQASRSADRSMMDQLQNSLQTDGGHRVSTSRSLEDAVRRSSDSARSELASKADQLSADFSQNFSNSESAGGGVSANMGLAAQGKGGANSGVTATASKIPADKTLAAAEKGLASAAQRVKDNLRGLSRGLAGSLQAVSGIMASVVGETNFTSQYSNTDEYRNGKAWADGLSASQRDELKTAIGTVVSDGVTHGNTASDSFGTSRSASDAVSKAYRDTHARSESFSDVASTSGSNAISQEMPVNDIARRYINSQGVDAARELYGRVSSMVGSKAMQEAEDRFAGTGDADTRRTSAAISALGHYRSTANEWASTPSERAGVEAAAQGADVMLMGVLSEAHVFSSGAMSQSSHASAAVVAGEKLWNEAPNFGGLDHAHLDKPRETGGFGALEGSATRAPAVSAETLSKEGTSVDQFHSDSQQQVHRQNYADRQEVSHKDRENAGKVAKHHSDRGAFATTVADEVGPTHKALSETDIRTQPGPLRGPK